ncbi:unnamed protein product [Cercospora beticola]|nr:unnamed protein product [Cercospora beticola]
MVARWFSVLQLTLQSGTPKVEGSSPLLLEIGTIDSFDHNFFSLHPLTITVSALLTLHCN